MLTIRPAAIGDAEAILKILAPAIQAGETYTLPRDLSPGAALGYWFDAAHEVFVAEDEGRVLGTYFIQANQKGGGSHVANCGYITAVDSYGRGVARAMCAHSMDHARARGFRDAIQLRGQHE